MIFGSIMFFIIIRKGLVEYITNYSFNSLAIFVIPWILEIIYAIFLLLNCFWLLVHIFLKSKTDDKIIKIEEPFIIETKNPFVNSDNAEL